MSKFSLGSFFLSPIAPAASSAVIRLTMPQQTQHSLVHLLLFWTTVLSIVQIVFVVLFFTNGHMSQNTSAVEAEINKQTQANSTSPLPAGREPPFGRMLSFRATEGHTAVSTITWRPRNADEALVSHKDGGLTLMKDGYYFLNLQVTLTSPVAYTTRVVLLTSNSRVLLEGCINENKKSTGLLGKAEELPAQETLSVSIDPVPLMMQINDTASATYLDIIYMQK